MCYCMQVTENDTKREYISWKFIMTSLSSAFSRFHSPTANVRRGHFCETGKERPAWLLTACAMAFVGIWIEKGMGLIVPGFIPSTLHEIVEYTPSLVEWKVSAGIWAFGLMILTVALKMAVPVLTEHKEERS